MEPPQDQFYTGLVSHAYAPLRGSVYPSEPYARFVRSGNGPSAEIGCGHGEPLLDLVAEGLDVIGVDSSQDMLERCRELATVRGLEVTLVCQRMEQLDLGVSLATIYFAGPTFQLVLGRQDAAETLRRIAQHLQPSGKALIQLFEPQPIDPALFGQWKEHRTDDGTVLAVRTVEQSFRSDERRVDTVLEYRRGPESDPVEVISRTWSLRWYLQAEFEDMAATAGLAIESRRDVFPAMWSYVVTPSPVSTR